MNIRKLNFAWNGCNYLTVKGTGTRPLGMISN